MWLWLLVQVYKNICCVGDDDQLIYGWCGVEVGNILCFEMDFFGVWVIWLEQNYCLILYILVVVLGLIVVNKGWLGKMLWIDVIGGELVCLIGYWDSEVEVCWIGEEIESFQGGYCCVIGKCSLNDIVILVWVFYQMCVFEDRFMIIGLFYWVIGGLCFYEWQEICDVMVYFWLVVLFIDDLVFECIVNVLKCGFGDKVVQIIQCEVCDRGLLFLEGVVLVLVMVGIGGKGGVVLW